MNNSWGANCTWRSNRAGGGFFSKDLAGKNHKRCFLVYCRNSTTKWGLSNIFLPLPGFWYCCLGTSTGKQEIRTAVVRSPLRPPYCPTYDFCTCAHSDAIENVWREIYCFQILARLSTSVRTTTPTRKKKKYRRRGHCLDQPEWKKKQTYEWMSLYFDDSRPSRG